MEENEQQDRLYEIAKFYQDNFENKQFHLRAGNKIYNLLEFDIQFNAGFFRHLAGLHKLTDIPLLQNTATMAYRDILSGNIKEKDIQQSALLTDETTKRIENFEVLTDILKAQRTMVHDVDGKYFSIDADYMITKSIANMTYAHLFLRKDKDNPYITTPVTFIIEPSTRYLQKKRIKWTILSVEEVEPPTPTKEKNVLFPLPTLEEEHERE